MRLITHMFHTSLIPFISLDQYLTSILFNIPSMQNMRFFAVKLILGPPQEKTCLRGLQLDHNQSKYLN